MHHSLIYKWGVHCCFVYHLALTLLGWIIEQMVLLCCSQSFSDYPSSDLWCHVNATPDLFWRRMWNAIVSTTGPSASVICCGSRIRCHTFVLRLTFYYASPSFSSSVCFWEVIWQLDASTLYNYMRQRVTVDSTLTRSGTALNHCLRNNQYIVCGRTAGWHVVWVYCVTKLN